MAQQIARPVERDLHEPRPNRQVSALWRPLDRANEGVLDDVFGVRGAAEHAVAEAPQERPVLGVDVGQRDGHRARTVPATSVPGPTSVGQGTEVAWG